MADDKEKKATEEEPEESVATAVEDSSDSSASSDSDSDSHDEEHDHDAIEWVEEPKFDIDYKGDCAYEVRVSIPPANEGKQAEKMFDELKSEAELPGFRRGRAPRKLLERKFGKAVRSDVEAKLVSSAFEKLVKDEDLNPIGYPDIDGLEELKDREDGQPIEVTLKFEVAPRVELGRYREIEVEQPYVTIDEQDVDDSIAEMLERHATYEPVEGATAQENDQLIIDFHGTIDGEPFEGGARENFPYILGSGYFFPEFEEALKGAKEGAELECDVTFPDDFYDEKMRGQKAHFTIKVNEIKRRVTPELTDELAKEMGHDNVDDFRAAVRERLEESAEARSRQVAESRALNAVVEDSSYEIPDSMIERIADDVREDQVRRMISAGVPAATVEEQAEELNKEAREKAISDIKTIVTLNEIAEAEGIVVTEEDWEQEAERMARGYGLDAEVVSQYLQTSDERGSFEDKIYRAKALQVIMDNAKITEKELEREELEEESENAETIG